MIIFTVTAYLRQLDKKGFEIQISIIIILRNNPETRKSKETLTYGWWNSDDGGVRHRSS